jgi:hypothetical protein
MSANINAQLAAANLQVIDNTASVQRVNSPIATIVAQATAFMYDGYMLIPTAAPLSLPLPASPCWTLFVRNISGTNNVSVIVTPNGGVAWTSPYVIVPTSVFLVIANYSTNPAAGGFTAVTLQSSGTGPNYAEVLLAA